MPIRSKQNGLLIPAERQRTRGIGRHTVGSSSGAQRQNRGAANAVNRQTTKKNDGTETGNRAQANLRHHQPPGRGQDDADRKAAALRRRDPCGGSRQVEQDQAGSHVRLHGNRAAARHLGRHVGHGLRVRRRQDQHPRHPRPRGLRRGHLPDADGRRQRDHRDRRR